MAQYLGRLNLRTMDSSDVFLSEDIHLDGYPDGYPEPDEVNFDPIEPGFQEAFQPVSGKVPEAIPVHVEGDVTVIHGYFKTAFWYDPYYIRVYIHYEETENLTEENQ
jgi:hypothetical protein